MFTRLHDRSRYAGTGIGLAICRRIAERHGGRIYLESEPGHGSAFHTLLPDGPASSHLTQGPDGPRWSPLSGPDAPTG